jgi:glyoxylase-like metal-dependent hydrolase (beta-lactamase superfamily II)
MPGKTKLLMQQITNNINQISLGSVNAFLIEDNGLTLVDTGTKGGTDKIFKDIEKGGKNPNNIKRIILTHCHPDHAGSVAEMKKRLNIPVWAHYEDSFLIEEGKATRMPMHLTPGLINWLVYNIFIKKAGSTIEAVKVDERLKDKDVLPIAGGVEVIHTPGHCAGHIALLVKSEGVLIAGDLCANVGGLGVSVVNEDRALSLASILKAAAFNFDTAVFGHGRPLKTSANTKLMKKFTSIAAPS